jgi:hypothetical protein
VIPEELKLPDQKLNSVGLTVKPFVGRPTQKDLKEA